MKSETQIAEENVRNFLKIVDSSFKVIPQTHLASCKRFLEFLDIEEDMYLSLDFKMIDIDMKHWEKRLVEKIKDLKKAIKIYEATFGGQR